MAFQTTKGRYASFGVAVSLPPELIDTFWEILIEHFSHLHRIELHL
ncbi:TPA: hypothetical protein TUL06_001099 [Streptococcus equi subsp. zooepidemicus]|nr:DUF960 domain-containing protein [Streptococcus equi subsp. zooepidemicus]VED86097.1 Staphylococcal protein of uncharacterised function (DUF960) [Streptococcus equi subsp. equi]MCD3412755.1 DUF960 domain-containing protein [Streptococcus equi subsp. zooepidemicus]MCD3413149.1 DUF960 domain-containing protein [Streptococcus equi subsp. zooepidemicus]MCD3413152.1 DUF960 domain-containing protein [Streptococcus equi subsp. zooepidemicus]